jgi:hypothetical protein
LLPTLFVLYSPAILAALIFIAGRASMSGSVEVWASRITIGIAVIVCAYAWVRFYLEDYDIAKAYRSFEAFNLTFACVISALIHSFGSSARKRAEKSKET